MNFLMIWSASTIVSVYTVFNQVFKMIKEFADEGYKINTKDVDNINNNMPNEVNNASRLSLLSMFIPIYNLFFALNFVKKYENNKDMIFMYLKSLGAIEEMEDFEKTEYQKNPTLMNFIQVSRKYEEYLKKSFKFTINDGNTTTEFYCIFENGDLRIVKTEGFYSRYSEEKQKELLCAIMSDFFKKIEGIYGNVEEFAKSLDGEKSIVINLEHDDEAKNKEKEKESISVKEKYEKLRNQVSRDREIFDDPYRDDNNKSLRLE